MKDEDYQDENGNKDGKLDKNDGTPLFLCFYFMLEIVSMPVDVTALLIIFPVYHPL